MLIPAILRADEIKTKFMEQYYSKDMMYWVGYPCCALPNIEEEPDDTTFQYAIVDKDNNLLGYMNYKVDWISSCAYNFGIFSFDKGNYIVGKTIYDELQKLIDDYRLHRIEWCMISGNPVERNYDKFCEEYDGVKHVLQDVFKDRYGNYHDRIIYEIFPN